MKLNIFWKTAQLMISHLNLNWNQHFEAQLCVDVDMNKVSEDVGEEMDQH